MYIYMYIQSLFNRACANTHKILKSLEASFKDDAKHHNTTINYSSKRSGSKKIVFEKSHPQASSAAHLLAVSASIKKLLP